MGCQCRPKTGWVCLAKQLRPQGAQDSSLVAALSDATGATPSQTWCHLCPSIQHQPPDWPPAHQPAFPSTPASTLRAAKLPVGSSCLAGGACCSLHSSWSELLSSRLSCSTSMPSADAGRAAPAALLPAFPFARCVAGACKEVTVIDGAAASVTTFFGGGGRPADTSSFWKRPACNQGNGRGSRQRRLKHKLLQAHLLGSKASAACLSRRLTHLPSAQQG